MKNSWKQTLLGILVLGGLLATGCREDEELNLPGYPENPVGITIAGTEDNASEVTLKATYEKNTGVLNLTGELTRTYLFSLATPSPEDVSFRVEPIIGNIPEELVSISETELRIPAGGISASVTVALENNDCSFMEGVYEARIYELGVRLVDAEGVYLQFPQTEAKLRIEKEAYTMVASVVGTDGSREALFERSCLDGEIVTETPIHYEYKVVLDKPALNDLTFSVQSSGTPEDYKAFERFSAAKVTIAAGELESEPVTWSAEDDFLEGNDDPATYAIELAATLDTEDPAVEFSENEGSCRITVTKTFDRLRFLSDLDPSWVEYDPSGWSVTPSSVGTLLFDGSTTTATSEPSIIFDLKEEKAIVGFRIIGYAGWRFYLPNSYSISISADGTTWSSQGELQTFSAPGDTQYIGLVKELNTRYVKLEAVEYYRCNWGEFDIYGKN